MTGKYIHTESSIDNTPYRIFSMPCNWYAASAVVVLASVLFWWKAIFQGKLVIHGANVYYDLPMMMLQSKMFHGDSGILWNDLISGGFPLFAEGQAALANPIKFALAQTLDPISALMAFHFSATLLGGMGILLLARAVGLTPLAGLFAAIAGGFSIDWIFVHNIMIWAGTLTMAPWVLLGTEHWLRRANLTSVLLLSSSTAMMVLSGYPMFTHGVALYAVFRVAAELLHADGRRMLRANATRLIGSGVAATALAIGLCAIQLIPLLELIPQSYRSEGIDLLFPGSLTLVIKGLLFSFIGSATFDESLNVPSVGSALVCILFLAGLFLCTNRRLFAHGIATLLLFNLGVQDVSPLFRFVYEHRLIPGLHYFRMMAPYLGITVIGFVLIAGGALDALAQGIALRRITHNENRPWVAGAVLLAIAIAVLAAGKQVYADVYGTRQFLAAIVVAPIYLLLVWRRQQRLLIPIALCLLVAECFWFRFGVFHFAERSVLAEPQQASAIKARPDTSRSWRTIELTNSGAVGFAPPDDPHLEKKIRLLIESLKPMINLQWQISSIKTATSLGLQRWLTVFNVMPGEFLEHRGTPGSRFIDILGVRYATLPAGQSLHYAQEIFHEKGHDWSVYENPHARPRFQLYHRARAFLSPDEVLKNWSTRGSDELFIESPASVPELLDTSEADLRDSSLAVTNIAATSTTLEVNAAAPVWLFMADANYPGWHVYVNGQKAPHYSAQILGKAVQIPAGKNTVEFIFEPTSFRIGAILSFISLLVALFLTIKIWKTRQRSLTEVTAA